MNKNVPIQPIHFFSNHYGNIKEGLKKLPTEMDFPQNIIDGKNVYFTWVRNVHPNLTPNRYVVSNIGKVHDLYNGGIELPVYKTVSRGKEYRRVHLSILADPYNIKDYNYDISRIVLLSFNYIPGCENMKVGHRNFNKDDNRIGNLYWITASESQNLSLVSDLIYNKKLKRSDDEYYNDLTKEEAFAIFKCYMNGMSKSDISAAFHIDFEIVYEFLNGERNNDWRIEFLYLERDDLKKQISEKFDDTMAEKICEYMSNNMDAIINREIKDKDIAELFNTNNTRAIQKIRLGTGYVRIASKYPNMKTIIQAFKKGVQDAI